MACLLYFATQNKHKLQEAQAILGQKHPILGLADLHKSALREPYDSLRANAVVKATYIAKRYNVNCFSEDTGLFVPTLQGAPGVHTARYAGPQATDTENCEKLCRALKDNQNKEAYFCSIIALCYAGTLSCFEGRCYGHIRPIPRGISGFGYDPIFLPDGSTRSFAEMSQTEKNTRSHRRKALQALSQHLTKQRTH